MKPSWAALHLINFQPYCKRRKTAHWRSNWSCSIWRWASHACTLLPMLELFEQLKSRGTSQMTWHHLKCRLIWWPQPGTISARDSTSDAFNFCISRSGCGRYIATQWFWAALHLRSSACVAEICCEPRTALDLRPVMLPSCLLSFFFRPYESSRS